LFVCLFVCFKKETKVYQDTFERKLISFLSQTVICAKEPSAYFFSLIYLAGFRAVMEKLSTCS
jgi:hypothetical protein